MSNNQKTGVFGAIMFIFLAGFLGNIKLDTSYICVSILGIGMIAADVIADAIRERRQ